jgi:dTMP kinase
MMSKMIVIEGLDGAGKTTIAKYLEKELDLKLYKFPDYKGFSILEDFLKGKIKLKDKSSFLIFLANIMEKIDKNKEGIYDRYIFSTIAYATTIDVEKAMKIVELLDFPKPYVVLYFDVKPQTALERKKNLGKKLSVREKIENLNKVYKRYHYMLSKSFYAKWLLIDANKELDEVKKQALTALKAIKNLK